MSEIFRATAELAREHLTAARRFRRSLDDRHPRDRPALEGAAGKTLEQTRDSLRYMRWQIEVPEEIRVRALRAVERMLAVGPKVD